MDLRHSESIAKPNFRGLRGGGPPHPPPPASPGGSAGGGGGGGGGGDDLPGAVAAGLVHVVGEALVVDAGG